MMMNWLFVVRLQGDFKDTKPIIFKEYLVVFRPRQSQRLEQYPMSPDQLTVASGISFSHN